MGGAAESESPTFTSLLASGLLPHLVSLPCAIRLPPCPAQTLDFEFELLQHCLIAVHVLYLGIQLSGGRQRLCGAARRRHERLLARRNLGAQTVQEADTTAEQRRVEAGRERISHTC